MICERVVFAELREKDLSLGAALMVHLYLADMACFGAANAEYCRHFPVSSPPARACLQAPLPPHLHVLVELLLPPADPRESPFLCQPTGS